MMEIPPITHAPHSQVIYVPNEFEVEVRLTLAVCTEGRCKREVTANFVPRWAACGVRAEEIPGIHWWDESIPTQRLMRMAWLHRAIHEGNHRVATIHREALAALREPPHTS